MSSSSAMPVASNGLTSDAVPTTRTSTMHDVNNQATTSGSSSIPHQQRQNPSTSHQKDSAAQSAEMQHSTSPLESHPLKRLSKADGSQRKPSPLMPVDGVSASVPLVQASTHTVDASLLGSPGRHVAGQSNRISASNTASSLADATMDTDDVSASHLGETSSAAPSPVLARNAAGLMTSQTEETMGSEARRSRRVLPARLLRVSSILAGDGREDDLGTPTKLDQSLLSPDMPILLSSGSIPAAYEHAFLNTLGEESFSFFSDPEVARSCRARELIETPEFKPWDEGAMLGKTRALRSEEDMSDAAYARRHRRGDKLEKRQRRLEKEALIRDRQKLKERIDQLRSADARLLMPILNAREKQSEARAPSPPSEAASAKASAGVSYPEIPSAVADTSSKLEQLRTELLSEALETLARYDALLPELVSTAARATPPIAPAVAPVERRNKRVATEEPSASGTDEDGKSVLAAQAAAAALQYAKNKARTAAATAARQRKARERREAAAREAAGLPPLPPSAEADSAPAKANPSASSTARTIKSTLKRLRSPEDSTTKPAATVSRRKSAPESSTAASKARATQPLARSASAVRQNRASLPSLKKPAVYAVKNHFNIHARTSGGRFAPKSALSGASKAAPSASGPPKKVPVSKGFRSSARSASTASPEPLKRSPRTARREISASSIPDERRASGSNRGIRGASGRFVEPPQSLLAYQQRQQSNRTGPSLSELEAANKRPRRVKLILGPDKRTQENGQAGDAIGGERGRQGGPSHTHGSGLTKEAVQSLDEDGSSDTETDVAPAFMPSALTLEQAQALMEAAMAEAGADDDDEDDEHAGGYIKLEPALTSATPRTSTSHDATSGAAESLPAQQKIEEDQMEVDDKLDGITPAEPSAAVSIPATDDAAALEDGVSEQIAAPDNIGALASPVEASAIDKEAGSPDTPSARYVPGRTAEARARAAAAIPSRRNSSRVKAASAFGEKIPEQTNKREDFDVTWHAQSQLSGWLQDMVVDRTEAQMGSREDSSDIDAAQR